MKNQLFILILVCLSVLISCSKADFNPAFTDSDLDTASAEVNGILPNEALLGLFSVRIDSLHTNADITPLTSRNALLGEQYLGDITGFLTTTFCTDCVKIDGISLTDEGYIDLSISIKHPFGLPEPGPPSGKNRLDLHLFDVWGLICTDEGEHFPIVNITANSDFLVNADGYSGIFDPVIDEIVNTENDHHPYKVMFEDPTEGNFDKDSLTCGFTDVSHPRGYNIFPQGSDFKPTDFILNIPPGEEIEFFLALTASYGVSAKWDIPEGEPGNRFTPRYFLPRFSRHEPWKINVTIPDYLNFLTCGNPDQTAEIRVDVWDWQDNEPVNPNWNFVSSKAGEIQISSDIEKVIILVPELSDNIILLNGPDGLGKLPRQFKATVKNEKQVPEGRYCGIIAAVDELDGDYNLLGFKRDGKTPFPYSKIRTYQFFNIDVKYTSTTVPENPEDLTPPWINGCFNDIAYRDNFTYVSAGKLGITILNVADPEHPQFISNFDTNGYASRMVLDSDGDHLYVADQDAGLAIINVQNPAYPFLEGTFDITGSNSACDVALSGNYAFLGDSNSGIAVLDVTDPSTPLFVNAYTTRPNVMAIDIEGNYLFKLVKDEGVEILNIADAEHIFPVGGLIINGTHRDIDVENGAATILLRDRLVTAWVANPSSPVLKGTLSLPADAQKVRIFGHYAFVANGKFGLKIINCEDITKPSLMSDFDTPGTAMSCFYINDLAYIADFDAGLVITSIAGDEINYLGAYMTSGMGMGIGISGEYVYVASGASGIKSINVSQPIDAMLVSHDNTPGYAYDCGLRENVIYVADGESGLALVNALKPENITYIGNIQFPAWENWLATGVKIEDRYAALWGPQDNPGFPDLILFDAISKYAPVKLSDLKVSQDIFDLSFSTGHIYASTGQDGILTIDVSNPSELAGTGIYSNGFASYTLISDDDYVYGMFHYHGLEILDASSPTELEPVGWTETSGLPLEVTISGDYIFTNNSNGLLIFDVSDRSAPSFVSSLEIPGLIREIIVRGNYAFIASSEAGLRIIKLW
jgi:hypothetical protein